MRINHWRTRLVVASALSLVVLSLWPLLQVFAADQSAALLQVIQGVQAGLNDLRARQITQSSDIKKLSLDLQNERSLMLRRTDAAQAAAREALAGLSDVDAGHEAMTMVQQDTRLTTIEALFKQQRDQAKADSNAAKARSDTEMHWIEVLVGAVFGPMLILLVGAYLHKKKMEASMTIVQTDVHATEKNTNDMREKLVVAEKKVSRQEGLDEGRESQKNEVV